ncbi:MAG: hypothetical protein WBQ08_08440 [Candidatus Sulfotelmatobacter sp.]
MKLIRLGSTAVLALLLGIAASAFTQETPDHPDRQEQKPAAQDDHAQPDRAQPKQAQKDERKENQQVVQSKDEKRELKPARIPDDRFRASYGRQHVFHVNQVTVVNSAPRFAYGGYTFVLVEPWPAGWYYTDNCYIDYVDGEYFLFDLLHPGARIAITVVL